MTNNDIFYNDIHLQSDAGIFPYRSGSNNRISQSNPMLSVKTRCWIHNFTDKQA